VWISAKSVDARSAVVLLTIQLEVRADPARDDPLFVADHVLLRADEDPDGEQLNYPTFLGSAVHLLHAQWDEPPD
jgi:hypothetical protein